MPPHTDPVPRGQGREALMRAAVEVVGQRGLENATVRRIAERAGVDNALIYHHFGNRDDLLVATLAWLLDQELLPPEGVSAEVLFDPRATERVMRLIRQRPEVPAYMYEMIIASRRHPGLRRSIDALYTDYDSVMQESLRARGLPHDLLFAKAVIAAIDGVILQAATVIDTETATAILHRLGEVLLAVAVPVAPEP